MFLKTLGVLVPAAAGAAWFLGAFGGSGYTRDVARPPAEVLNGLADLDIRRQPGSPGTDPSRSGGVMPVIQVDRGVDRMVWTVMSGDKVATRMTALVQPIDGGQHSRVTAMVERGDAPDDFVSPAFRSKGLTMGLFGAALEDDLNQLTAPPPGDPAKCRQLMIQFAANNAAAGYGQRPHNVGQAMGQTAKTVMGLSAMEAELRRNGCKDDPVDFEAPKAEMTGDGSQPRPEQGEVRFESGKPMVDVSRK